MQHAKFEDLLWYMKDPTMIVLVGVPGSGKSTFTERLISKKENWISVSADSVRKELYGDEAIQGNGTEVFRRFYEDLEKAFQTRKHIAVDNTNCKPSSRSELALKAKLAGYKLQYWVFDVPLATCLSRNKLRDRKVPETVIKSMYTSLDTITPTGPNVVTVLAENDEFKFIV